MEVRLSPARTRFVRLLVEGGDFATPEEAVDASLRLLEARGGANPLRTAVALGLEQALAGRSAPVSADEIVHRGLRREATR